MDAEGRKEPLLSVQGVPVLHKRKAEILAAANSSIWLVIVV